jgi:hypothetical protein
MAGSAETALISIAARSAALSAQMGAVPIQIGHLPFVIGRMPVAGEAPPKRHPDLVFADLGNHFAFRATIS